MDIAEIENESLQAMGIVTGNSIVKVLKFQDPCWVNQKSSFEKDFSFFLPFFGGGRLVAFSTKITCLQL